MSLLSLAFRTTVLPLTDDANDELILDAVYADNERIVHDVDVRQELAIIVQRATQNSFGMFP